MSRAVEQPRIEAVRAIARTTRVLERASCGLSLAHYRVLSAIASGDARASHVAHHLAVGKPAISAAVDALSQRGLISREPVAGDHRAVMLQLTAEGARVLADVETAMAARLHELVSRSKDPNAVYAALEGLGEALDERFASAVATKEARP